MNSRLSSILTRAWKNIIIFILPYFFFNNTIIDIAILKKYNMKYNKIYGNIQYIVQNK